MKILLFGPPGSGKGTQSAMLSKFYDGIPFISTGEILREEATKTGDLAREIDTIISAGNMVEDSVIEPILERRLMEKDCENGFILDGFPRNIEQAIYLDNFLALRNEKIDAVVVIAIDDDIVFKRTTGRFQCARCKKIYNKYFANVKIEGVCDECKSVEFIVRADDINEAVIHRRIDIYRKMSEPIIEFYEKKDLTYFVDGTKSSDEIYQDILNNFSKKFNNK
ncbi:MAG: nucleoside monophosphate kinase, partial [Rickettsiales bacterium]|jgi:adenylate kinase|nr:nucleoside monophosphate kinase [Rickettsiales bacterium]